MSLSETASLGGTSSKINAPGGCNVQVAVRCRPLNGEEKKSGSPTVINCDIENKAIKVAYGPAGKKIMKNFAFDKVFGTYSRQEEVFDQLVRPIVDETLAGFNCTIFAYGQTGTGKTHTMEGDILSEEDAGIVPRAVRSILEQLEASATEFTIRVSFLELYNEELQDLLNTSGEKKLKLCEDVKKGVVCQNLEEIAVLSAQDILDILQRGIQQRQTAATLCNKNSSRSHTIFTLKIMIKEYNVEGEEVVRHGQLNLVDLAGSECIGRSGAKNDRAREAGNINQSLLTLGRVITALVDHHVHVPYRDSKLTRLLQESLGGKAKTCIIATLSPSANAVEESMSTLDYAYRARNIKNQPTVNQKLTKKVIMKEYFQEIETLRTQLMLTREKNGVYVSPDEFYAMESRIQAQESQLRECEAALKMRIEESKALRVDNDELGARVSALSDELDDATTELRGAREELGAVKDEFRNAVVELKACEAVIAEQAANERALISQGRALTSQLEQREGEVSRLLDKVARLENQEQARLAHTQAFVRDLQGSHASLTQQLLGLMSQTEQQSDALGRGVQTMLAQGRDTCAALQQALGDALQMLVTSAGASKDDMLGVLKELQRDLVSGGERSSSQLVAINGAWSEWLDGAEASLGTIQGQLQQQQTRMGSLVQAVEVFSGGVQAECKDYVTKQAECSAQLQREVKAMRNQMQSCTEHFDKQSSQQIAEAQKALQAKALALEQTVSALMSDFLKASQAALDQSVETGRAHFADMRSAWATGLDGVLANGDSATTLREAHTAAVLKLSSAHMSESQQSIAVLQALRQGVHDESAVRLSAIGLKRKQGEEDTRGLLQDLNATTKKACQEVQYTAEAANQVLSKVHSAAQQMQSDSSVSLQRFTVYMDGEGAQLQQGIQTFFESAGDSYSQQKDELGAVDRLTGAHRDAFQACEAAVSGATPRKAVVSSKPVLQPTRSHAAIKGEVKAQQDFTFDDAMAALQAFAQPSSARSSRGSELVDEEVVRVADVEDVLKPLEKVVEVVSEETTDSENIAPTNVLQRSSSRRGKGAGIPSITTRTRSGSNLKAEL